jgi:hypothetical protein
VLNGAVKEGLATAKTPAKISLYRGLVIQRRAKLLILGGCALLVVLGSLLLPKLHYVDPKPANAFGDEYFTDLKDDQIDNAFAMYTEGFLQKRGDEWRKLMNAFDAQGNGPTDFRLLGSQVAPVTLRNSNVIPCVLTRYQVTRGTFVTDETLTICPHQRGDEPGIAGHGITRRDTGQHFEAGLTIQLKTILSTK